MANHGKYTVGIRLLLEKQYLETNAGRNRYVKRSELEKFLKEQGYPVEKKTIYADFAVLETVFGLQLEYNPRKKGYRLLNPKLDMDDLCLLVDCVQASPLITDEDVSAIVQKLKTFVLETDRSKLDRPTVVAERITRKKDSVLKRINTIYSAIAEKKQLSFCYMYYRPDRDLSAKISKHVFVVNPKQLLWREGTLYMETYANGPIRYPGIEVAEMRNVKKLGTPCIAIPDPEVEETLEMFRQLDIEEKASIKTVTIRFHNPAAAGVLDMFGQNTILIPYDENHFIINVKEHLDNDFYGRIAMFGWMAKIMAPDEAYNGFAEFLNEMADLYNDDVEPETGYLPFNIAYEKFMNQENLQMYKNDGEM